MNPRERGFLLLGCSCGNPGRRVLTEHQLRVLAQRVCAMPQPWEDRELSMDDLKALGYGPDMAGRILGLLEEEDVLDHYLHRAKRCNAVPVTRVSPGYPLELRQKLGSGSPGCLWAKGDLSLLDMPKISLVGSRELQPENRIFAAEAGRQAASQGFVLVSGNARGADRTAQDACLAAGGRVISIVADSLTDKPEMERVLWLSEEDFDMEFSAQRALSRNRCIHALGAVTLVAQSSYRSGGTWDGTVKNLRFGWSGVRCFDNGSPAAAELEQMGASLIGTEELSDLCGLLAGDGSLFDATLQQSL